MEELLNKLIERGRKPFWNKKIKDAKTSRWNKNLLNEETNKVSKFKDKVAFTNWVLIFDEINMRELVSKESWLRQFVCENGMIEIGYWKIREKYDETAPTTDKNKVITYSQLLWEDNYEYRLMESALKDESELERFLLDNIKVD